MYSNAAFLEKLFLVLLNNNACHHIKSIGSYLAISTIVLTCAAAASKCCLPKHIPL